MAYANTTTNVNDDITAADAVADIHLTSIYRILERGVAAPLDGLMMGIGASGHKLFLACVDVPQVHPDAVTSVNFPQGVTVGTLAATLLGASEAIKLIAIARLNQVVGNDVVLAAHILTCITRGFYFNADKIKEEHPRALELAYLHLGDD